MAALTRLLNLLLPSPSGEGSGVGRRNRRRAWIGRPTPTPPLKGRGYPSIIALNSIAFTLLLAIAGAAHADLSPRDLAAAGAHPPAGARLPAALPFTDQRGAPTTLGAVAGGRPTVLLFVDYTCRHLCGPGAALTAAALDGAGLTAGRDVSLAVVGLDPHDGLSAARAFAPHLGDPVVARAAALLTGTPAAIAAAEHALGYRAVYDPASDQWAHDASVYVFAADGRLSAVLPELGLTGPALTAALAGAAPPESFGDKVAHLCWGLAAAHGPYGRAIVLGLQGMAVLTLGALAAVLLRRRFA